VQIEAPPPVIEQFGRISVVRDDLLEGGSKTRFLPVLLGDAKEIVFGGPFCGGAPWALSVIAPKMGKKATLFYGKRSRARWHWRQLAAQKNGANIIEVDPGYMTNVQAKARAYAAAAGALFLPLGFDVPAAEAAFISAINQAAAIYGEKPDQVWCATGSGMLARCLAKAFPASKIFGVAVGLQSRWKEQRFPDNVTILPCAYKFEQQTPAYSPFPCCRNYDRKAWELCAMKSKGRVLFWNVAR